MTNLRMDPDTGDLDTKILIVSGTDSVVQRLKQAFRFLKGSWFLDIQEGIPYVDYVLIKGPNLSVVSEIFRSVILRDPDVARILSFSLDVDSDTRSALVTFRAKLKDGSAREIGPLIIDISELS